MRRIPEPGVYCGLDWIRLTGSETALHNIRNTLTRWFGEQTRATFGAIYFKAGEEWDPGVQLSWDHKDDVIMVDIRGERLRTMEAGDAISLLYEIGMHGCKATRLDVAIDYVCQDVQLYRQALESCEAGQLCRLRSFEPAYGKQTCGIVEKRLLKLGKRDSAVCIRIYDKGLEQKALPEGAWERFEVEFKEDQAECLMHELTKRGEDWLSLLASRAVGACDFREKNGYRELSRRRRVRWWAALVDTLDPMRMPPIQTTKSFETWRGGLTRSYAPRLVQMAQAAEISLGNLIEWLIDGVAADTREDVHMAEFLESWRLFTNEKGGGACSDGKS